MKYPGGKNAAGTFQKIINIIPPHKTYIELFLGSGAIMRLKRPAETNIGCDLSAKAIRNFNKPDWWNSNCHLIQGNAIELIKLTDNEFIANWHVLKRNYWNCQ